MITNNIYVYELNGEKNDIRCRTNSKTYQR